MITICFVYFRGLTLAHLEAALYTISRQRDFASVRELFVVDNNTNDDPVAILAIINQLAFPFPVTLRSYKHGDVTKTHSWSTNVAVREARTPWVFFCRADYLLDFDVLDRFWSVVCERPGGWDGFVTSKGAYVGTLPECGMAWRDSGPQVLRGTTYDHTMIDAGVWMARRESFDRVGGLNEHLTAWGHAQTHFQWKLHQAGVEFQRVDDVLFFHPDHGGEKDIVLANQQLAAQGVNLQEMWARYEGPRMY